MILQQMVGNVSISGVVFTRELRHLSPYYSVNYDDISGRTDVVTSGKSNGGNRTLYVLRDRFGCITSPRFQKLLTVARVGRVFPVRSPRYRVCRFS